MVSVRSPLGQRLFELRKAAGLTGKQLGKLCGLSACAISNIERCRRKPSFEVAVGLAKALGVTLDDLPELWDTRAEVAEFVSDRSGSRELDDLIFFRHVRELRSFVTARKEALGANPEYDNITAGLDLIVEAFHRLRKA